PRNFDRIPATPSMEYLSASNPHFEGLSVNSFRRSFINVPIEALPMLPLPKVMQPMGKPFTKLKILFALSYTLATNVLDSPGGSTTPGGAGSVRVDALSAASTTPS